MTRRLLVSVLIAFAAGTIAVGVPAAPAAAANVSQVISDCNTHGRLTQRYSVAQLRTALNTMPADVKEYTDCYDVIQRTLLAQLGGAHTGGGGDSGSGSAFLPTPLIVVLAVLALAALGFAAVALRRRREA
jgi:hypothetical protein